MNGLADWWALLDADPGAFPWYAFADFLGEWGDPRADAAREVDRRGWAPRSYRHSPWWSWWLEGVALPAGPDDLPGTVFRALSGGVADDLAGCRDYPSPSAACVALLDALTLVVGWHA